MHISFSLKLVPVLMWKNKGKGVIKAGLKSKKFLSFNSETIHLRIHLYCVQGYFHPKLFLHTYNKTNQSPCTFKVNIPVYISNKSNRIAKFPLVVMKFFTYKRTLVAGDNLPDFPQTNVEFCVVKNNIQINLC